MIQTQPSVQDIERSLIKGYRRYIWRPFTRAINEFEMVTDGDKIAVAISGGKDSLTLAKCFQELRRHGKMHFDLEFIAMDPGYIPEKRRLLEIDCDALGIPVKIHDSNIFEASQTMDAQNPCYLCARMRRGNLYAKARELGCNKLALGHHFDDVIETVLLNVLFGANYKTMMPKLRSANFEGLELIRPLYYVREASVKNFVAHAGIEPLDCACVVSANKEEGSMRAYIKGLIQQIEKKNPNVGISILRSAQNVELGAVLEYKDKQGERTSFLDNY
ncbi:tRNA 2-thiocytidine(32) synthetase TtcA [Peptoniphilus equinus]|uniref:tRNA 2-thiocytidine(32) synthetase TtcA n=1 Tax=Peptoniphilus equinus TaxID=3016343 RepID=A0ABY7QU52_9FIRM|nr:ATP-binding protein [Peptoniphilus equinus]WBW50262.1 tRNA 2-thiocytidine(32) synthetase TtcA [Peptoniphilus equinus]